MAKSKKILSLALALVMALSVLSISAFAATTTPTGSVGVSADVTSVSAGEDVTITVTATAAENYYVGPVSVPIEYDSSLFTVKSVTANEIFGAGLTEIVTNTGVAGKVTVIITPDTNGTPQAPNLNGATLTLYTVVLTAKADVTGTDSIAIIDDLKTASHTTGVLYMGSYDKAEICDDTNDQAELTTYGQTINLAPAAVEVTVGSAMEPADLELTAQGTTDGVVIDTRITFGGQYDGVVYGFKQVANTTFRANNTYITNSVQATNGGSIAMSRSIGTAGWGTGTVITVKNADDSVSKNYVVVIFGDVNCDGLINANDTTACKGYVNNQASLTNKVVRMAANCQKINNATMMYNLNGNDTTAIKAYVNNTAAKVSQADLAATVKNLATVNANYQ